MAKKDVLGRVAERLPDTPERAEQTQTVMARLTAPPMPESGGRSLETIGVEIRDLTAGAKVSTLWYAVEIGRRLAEAKEQCHYGKWTSFLKQETEFSERKAQNLMRVYNAYGSALEGLSGTEAAKPPTYAVLSFSQALELLALPEDEREEFVEANDVENMSARELRQAIKERDEARKALDTALEDVRKAEEYAAGLSEEKKKLAGELGDAEAAAKRAAEDLEEARGCAAAAADLAKKATEEAEQLKAQVKELESRPVDVAVMAVDQEALEKAKADAIAEMQEKLDKAKAAKKKADEKRQQTEKALAKAQEESEKALSQARDEARQAAEKAEAAVKQARIAGDKELATFEVFFLQGKDLANKMRGILLKVRARDDPETAGKLEKAMCALGEAIKGAAG